MKELTQEKSTHLKHKMVTAIFDLEMQKGHLKWSVSQAARMARVSRSLVYYYLGKTKKEMLLNAMDFLTRNLYGLSEEKRDYQRKSLIKLLVECRSLYKANPGYAVFCQKWAEKPSVYKDLYDDIRDLYDEKLKSNFPHLSSVQRRSVRVLFYGIIAAPNFESNEIPTALGLLQLEKKGKG